MPFAVVGVLVNVFADMKRQEEEGDASASGFVLMTDEQKQWCVQGVGGPTRGGEREASRAARPLLTCRVAL